LFPLCVCAYCAWWGDGRGRSVISTFAGHPKQINDTGCFSLALVFPPHESLASPRFNEDTRQRVCRRVLDYCKAA
jgi:hypothetical protein